MPKCAKCNCIIKKDFSTSNSCNKTYHPGCAHAYLGSKSARGCCLASLSNSYQRISLTTMTEPVYNAVSGLPSDPQTLLYSVSAKMTLAQQHLQAAAASGASTSFVPHQHQQAASIPQSVSSVPQQHPQAATVSDEMSLFNTLDRDAKMSRMYEFMFTHMRGLETRQNEVAKNTSVDRRPLWRDSFFPLPSRRAFLAPRICRGAFPPPRRAFPAGRIWRDSYLPPPRTGVDVGLGSAG